MKVSSTTLYRNFYLGLGFVITCLLADSPIHAQSLFNELLVNGETLSLPADSEGGKIVLPGMTLPTDTTLNVSDRMYNDIFYLPLVFDSYDMSLSEKAGNPLIEEFPSDGKPTSFFDRRVKRDYNQKYFMQQVMIDRPEIVRYNMATMPRPPKKFVMHLDPTTAKLSVEEFESAPLATMKDIVPGMQTKKINWLHSFDGSLQFSQAFVSPNWYQGGNSNLNMIANVLYNVKLNPKFNTRFICENSISYKLGLNNAPEDSLHQYNISEDVLQVNTKLGVKAWDRWYYSVTGQFKTQLLNSYKVNSHEMVAAFLSPAELNVGLGMTYNYENKRKTLSFAASIAPFSYNLKTCTNSNIDPTTLGIDEGHTTKSEFGSTVEINFKWQLTYNISYTSRLFAFTDYNYIQSDWENTIDFAINRFMSTKLYAHLRYDSQTSRVEGSSWHKLQFKEILSIGFAYKFSRL
jgi:hypothetical protein